MQPISLKFWGNIQDNGLDGYYKFHVPKGNRSMCMKLLELWYSPIHMLTKISCCNAGSTAFLLNNYYWTLWSLGCKQGGNVV